MSTQWTRTVVEQASDVKGTPMVVLLCLAWHANDGGFAWPSLATIAEWAHVGIRQVERVLDGLVALGWVTREPRPGKSSIFRLYAEPLTSDVTPDIQEPPTSDVTPDIPDPRHLMSPLTSDPPPTSDVVQPLTSDVVQKDIEIKDIVVESRTEPQRDVVGHDIPAHVQQHQLAFVTSADEAERWRRAWIEVRELAHEWDPVAHLSMYLAKSKRRRRAVSPDDWVAWFTEDEQKARVEARERAAQQNGHDPYEEQIAATVRYMNRERREQEAREAQR